MNSNQKKQVVSFAIDPVALEYLDQMRSQQGMSRSMFMNTILIDKFHSLQRETEMRRVFDNLLKAKPDVVAKLLDTGVKAVDTFTDEEVKAIAGK